MRHINLFRFRADSIDFSFFPKFEKTSLNHSTPFFLIDKKIVTKRLLALSSLIESHSGPHSIAYSFKTNYALAENYHFDLAEVVSQNELCLAKKYHYPLSKIIINGPNKGNLFTLLPTDITINLDNFSEISVLLKYPKKIKALIGLRLNSNAHSSRFGFNLENGDAQKALKILQTANINLTGLHFHAGSDIQNPFIYSKSSQKIADFIKNNNLTKLKYIDFGGGFPSHGHYPGSTKQSLPNITQYIKAICTPLKNVLGKNLPKLILEPGRYLVDDATVFVTKVIDVKDNKVTVDATINMLPSTWYRPHIIKSLNKSNRSVKTIIYGCSCQESDILFNGQLAPLAIGDLLVFYCVGAYNQSQASDFIFQKPDTFFS